MITPPDDLVEYVGRLVKLIGSPCEVWWIGSGAAGKQNPKDLDLLVKGCPTGTYDKLALLPPLVAGSRFDVLVEIGPHEYRAPWPTDDRGQKHLGANGWEWTQISPTLAESAAREESAAAQFACILQPELAEGLGLSSSYVAQELFEAPADLRWRSAVHWSTALTS